MFFDREWRVTVKGMKEANALARKLLPRNLWPKRWATVRPKEAVFYPSPEKPLIAIYPEPFGKGVILVVNLKEGSVNLSQTVKGQEQEGENEMGTGP